MRLRRLRLLPILLALGCTAVTARPPADAPHSGDTTAETPQDATRSLLAQAARHLEDGDEEAALPCLTRYVEAHPDHATIRAHLAELLLRMQKPAEARSHLERYIADAQRQGDLAARHLVHSHTRLVEIATSQGDEFSEHLYRGVGLYLVAESVLKQDAEDPSAQRILFQAIAELKLAVAIQPEEPRPHWYLYECWANLGQSQPARTHLLRARKLAPLGGLTSCEREMLALAAD